MSTMIEVRAAELIGPALDWAVAKSTGAEELSVGMDGVSCIYETPRGGCWTNIYSPSTDWSQGGPLIDKCRIGIEQEDQDFHVYAYAPGAGLAGCFGDTALIAACRTIVAAKLGDVVQVPAGLVREVAA